MDKSDMKIWTYLMRWTNTPPIIRNHLTFSFIPWFAIAPTIPEKKSEQVEIVDDEVSFNFKTPTKIEPEIKTEDMKMEWLKTMVIIYDIIFDIKTEKKDDYEEKVKFPKKKKKRRRFGRYWQNWKFMKISQKLANYHTTISGFKNITNC